MTRDELRDLITNAKKLIPKLEKAWKYFENEEIINLTETKQLPCDSCEDRKIFERSNKEKKDGI